MEANQSIVVASSAYAEGAVQPDEGVIRGVSLISTPEAKGHNISIDKLSIQSFYDAVEGKSIKAYYTHSDDNDALSAIGLWENFAIKEDEEYTKLTADFKALEAWKENNKKDYDMLFELASKAPEAFGVSAEFTARTIVYGEDGEEKDYQAGEDDDVEVFARAMEVSAFSIVAQPAANPTGLFSADTSDVQNKLIKLAEQNKEVEMELKLTKENFEKLGSENTKLQSELEEAKQGIEKTQLELESWKARYAEVVADSGADPVQVTEAVELSFEQQLKQCKNNLERQNVIQSNMTYLSENWNKLK